MKKLMTIGTALALALTLSATGCKKKTDDAAKTPTETAKPEEKPATPPAMDPAVPPAPPTAPAVDPATNPTVAAATGVPECDEYLSLIEKVAACDKFAAAADGVKKAGEAWKASIAGWGQLDEASRKTAQSAAATTCKAASDGLKASATSMGCTL